MLLTILTHSLVAFIWFQFGYARGHMDHEDIKDEQLLEDEEEDEVV